QTWRIKLRTRGGEKGSGPRRTPFQRQGSSVELLAVLPTPRTARGAEPSCGVYYLTGIATRRLLPRRMRAAALEDFRRRWLDESRRLDRGVRLHVGEFDDVLSVGPSHGPC